MTEWQEDQQWRYNNIMSWGRHDKKMGVLVTRGRVIAAPIISWWKALREMNAC